MKMGSIFNNHFTTILAPHSYSSSQKKTFYFQFTKTPICNKINRFKKIEIVSAKKKNNPSSELLISPSIVDEISQDDEFLEEFDQFDDDDDDDEGFDEDDDFEDDDFFNEDAEPKFGDGGGGGGISLAGTTWDKEVLMIAEEVSSSFDGELGIYAFKTLQNSDIRVRIERLTNKSGSPDMEDIEAFTKAYRERLNEAEAAGTLPVDISLEVSSPGLERVVRIPQDLQRFKGRPMYVKYTTHGDDATSSSENEGILKLESFNLDTKCCTWGIADVRVNREKAGKGRPLNKKQKEWRLDTPFDSLLLVRIYADI